MSSAPVNAQVIVDRIAKHLPSAQVKVSDMTGGGDHWQLVVRASEFKGKSLVEQHQMVYQALGDLMRQAIHALALDTGEL